MSVASRLKSELALKFALLVILNVLVYGPYIYLQHHHFFPAITMRASFVDRQIPFRPQTVWLYLSIYLLMPIGPFLMQRRREILQYAIGIVLIGVTADVVFLFWPTICPRPSVAGDNATFQTLIAIDNSFHAFPSLHAAFAVYSALCGSLVLRESVHFRFWQFGFWLWTMLILLATLTTKQHVLADILAGSAMGFMIFRIVFAHGNCFSPKMSHCRTQPQLNPTRNAMKTRYLLITTITAICSWNLIAHADDDADRNALRMIRTNYVEGANSGDLSKFKDDLSAEVTGVMVTGAAVNGFDDLAAYWKGIQNLIGPGGTYHVAVNVDKTDLFGDVAVSRGTTDETVHLANGTDFHFNSFWTAVCHKENGNWKVYRMQATLDPIHNVFVAYLMKKVELIYGAIGLGAGIILCLLLRLVMGKSKRAVPQIDQSAP